MNRRLGADDAYRPLSALPALNGDSDVGHVRPLEPAVVTVLIVRAGTDSPLGVRSHTLTP